MWDDIFVEVIFKFSPEIGFFGLTWRVMLLSRCILKTLRSKISCFKKMCAFVGKKSQNVIKSNFYEWFGHKEIERIRF